MPSASTVGATGREVGIKRKKKEERKKAMETICALDVEKRGATVSGTLPSQRSLCLCRGLVSSETH